MTDLQTNLGQFTGTEAYHRFSVLFRNVVITDGVQYLADQAGAYWLLDVIGSHLPSVPKDEGFVIAVLKTGDPAQFTLCADLPATKHNTYATQEIEFTDFPLPQIKLYVARQDDQWVVMLPSEY